MTSATLYPFQKCVRGHDLTGDDSFVAQPNGNRRCRNGKPYRRRHNLTKCRS
jgi:hypothetical protein